jgi:lipoate-protein ligase A
MGTTRVDSFLPFSSIVRAQDDLLRRGEPAVHVAVVSGTTLSVGLGVPAKAAYLDRARAAGVPTIRRSSGGTGVLHLVQDLVWAVVLPRADPRVGRDFVRGYPRFGAGLVTALAELGVTSAWVPAPGLSEECCPLSSRGFVLETRGAVVGAAAQHLTGAALLHHGTLSTHVDRDLVARVFEFPEPSVVDRLTGLDERGVREPPHQLAEALRRSLASDLGVI